MANIDLANEQVYLSNLASNGDEGQRIWAQNKAKEYGITLGQPNIQQPVQTPAVSQSMPSQSQPTQQFNQEQQMAEMTKWNQQMADSSYKQQKAQLDMMLESQISQLKKAYDQAVTDGKISVREAESQFEDQKKSIEQQAYLDAERTGLYTQDIGIQNSQQAVGLMQGDNARKNGLINQNMTTRDKRVSDIKDRLNSIKTQKNLDLVKAQAEHSAGLLGARASANQQMAQNMFGLMQNDYSANRDQSFAQQNMATQQNYNQQNMAIEQGYNQQNIETQFQNALKASTHDSMLAIDRMNVQQGLDLQKMAQSLQNDIIKMAKQFGYSSALSDKENENAIKRIDAEYQAKVKAEEDAYQKQLKRDLAGLDPKSNEYKVITGNYERNLKQSLMELHTSSLYEAMATDIFTNSPSTEPTPPKSYSGINGLGLYQNGELGELLNSLTNYDGKTKDYNAQMEAYKRRLAFMEDPYSFIK